MTVIAPPEASPTTTQILFGSGDETVDLLAESLDRNAVVKMLGTALAALGKAGRKVAAREVAAVASRLLDHDVGELLKEAWKKYEALVAAGRTTFESPGRLELVEMFAHRVVSTHRPAVDVVIDGKRVATLNFELSLSLIAKGMIAVVTGGELVRIQGGSCDVSATLSAEGVEIVNGEGKFDLGVIVRPEEPVRLWPALDGVPL